MSTRPRVLVTGANGFIGTRVVELLAATATHAAEHGAPVTAKVTAAVRDLRRAAHLRLPGSAVRQVDWLDRRTLAAAVRGHDVVINTAHDFRASERANLRGFDQLVEACETAGVEKLVHVSSIVVYDGWPAQDLCEDAPRGAPGGAYKNAKFAMEERLRERAARGALRSVVLQPTIVYGPRGWMWTDRIVEQLATGTLLLPARCDGCCNAVYVDDVAAALVRAAEYAVDGTDSFIVSGPEPVTWREFFEAYARMVGGECLRFEEAGAAEPGAAEPGAAAAGEAAGQGAARGGLRALLADPLRLANAAPVRRALGIARGLVGEAALERVRGALLRLRARGGSIVHRATHEERRLYAATGRCRVGKAREVLGFAPQVAFAEGERRTAAYVRAKLAREPGARSA
jgi:nucleoside-diphosphate-sugar epimerase